jgi:hypothetical protein
MYAHKVIYFARVSYREWLLDEGMGTNDMAYSGLSIQTS